MSRKLLKNKYITMKCAMISESNFQYMRVYNSVVEHSTTDREVLGLIPSAP